MSKREVIEVVKTIVDELKPFSSEERLRMIQASMTLLGESQPVAAKVTEGLELANDAGDLPNRVRVWMRQNNISSQQIQQVFEIDADGAQVIAAQIPGKSNRDKVRNAYILTGVAQFLKTGETNFDDKNARKLCEESGFYDHTNHSKYLKGGNEFTGSSKKGWKLTSPGLKAAAILILELSRGE